MLATLTVQQLQTLVIAISTAIVIIAPIVAGAVVVVIRNLGMVKEAWGKLDSINGTLEAHNAAINRLGERTSQLMERVPLQAQTNGVIQNGTK